MVFSAIGGIIVGMRDSVRQMKILAISDAPSYGLETLITRSPEKLKDIGLIISCGDLDREYLEFIVDGLNKDLFFVHGNHPCEGGPERSFSDAVADGFLDRVHAFKGKNAAKHIAGRGDLHGKVEVFSDYLVAGFGGTLWYNGKENQYTERQMARVTRQVERKIRWHRLQEKLPGRKRKEIIVVSHAPIASVHDQPDLCHTGFKCFRDFVKRVSPLLWIHGHIHLPDMRQTQISLVDSTTVVNSFGCKFITIDRRQIQVSANCES